MAFLVPRDPLTPARTLQARLVPGTRILRAAEVAAWADAQGLLQAARAQADAILAGAEQALEQERQRGYAQGLAEARMEQAEKMIETVTRTVDYFAAVEGDMVALVMGAIRKIIEGYDDHERVLLVVKNALAVVATKSR